MNSHMATVTNLETAIAEHYGSSDLLERILAGVEAAGLDKNKLQPEDIAPVDEFHLGGRLATLHALSRMSVYPDQRNLDVGCGIGGAARFIASATGAHVTGIDLTPDYIQVAEKLTELTGLADKVTFKIASALDMPYEDATFDAATTFHVAMNIPDRAGLYAETARVLKPGATFCVYDVMKKTDAPDAPVVYPTPWAETAETSHLTTPDEMRGLLDHAGFKVLEVEDRSEFVLDFFNQRSATATDGPPPLGVHILTGSDGPQKFSNVREAITNGTLAPVQMIAVRNPKA